MMDPAHETSEVNSYQVYRGGCQSCWGCKRCWGRHPKERHERHVRFGNVLLVKTVSKHPAIRENTAHCKRVGMVGNKNSWYWRKKTSRLGAGNNHYRLERHLGTSGSWHIQATPRSLAGLWQLAVLVLASHSSSRHLAPMTELWQLLLRAQAGDYIGEWRTEKKCKYFHFLRIS